MVSNTIYKTLGIFVVATTFILLQSLPASSHAGHSHDSVVVRVQSYNPQTYEYTISCTIPEPTAGSKVDQRRFYAIDPIPAGSNRSYYSNSSTFTWKLDPLDFKELVHSNAMYHLYCEVQNFSAPPGKQNLASEFHVDLRTTHNQNDPNIYVLDSEGPRVTLKCDPPPGVKDYSISWKLRNRDGITSYPNLNNKRIVNITAPQANAGWDVVCDVFDKRSGKLSTWDMPIEFFEEGPAYAPTIEGCLPNQPCYQVSSDGIVPNGSLIVSTSHNSTPTQADIYINEKHKGQTNANGALQINNIIPGLYNLVIRKQGMQEITTLVPIAAGKQLYRDYSLQQNTIETSQCYNSVAAIPASCTSGTITQDSASGSCRTITCTNGASSMKIQACNKPDNSPDHFEMYKQSQVGSLITQICIGNTCIKDSGFVRSQNFPICTGNSTVQQPVNGTLRVFSNPNQADVFVNNVLRGNTGFIGEFTQSLASGTYSVRVSKADYNNFTTQARITKGEITEINAVLSPASQANNQTNSTTNTAVNQTSTCYTGVATIPATCIGTITQDTPSGTCRTLVCSNAGSSIKVLACDKPDSGAKQYYEMYRQTTTSSTPQLCIGNTCIQNEGYKKSANYPTCIASQTNTTQTENPPTNTTPPSNNTEPEPGPGSAINATQQCFSKVNDIPATCTATITQDTKSGCRTLVCGTSTDSIKVLACDKPDSGAKQYFELYRQATTGIPPNVCLAQTCIQTEGYKKSPNYPICT